MGKIGSHWPDKHSGNMIGPFKIIKRTKKVRAGLAGKWAYEYVCFCGKTREDAIDDIKTYSTNSYCRCKDNKNSEDICSKQLWHRYKHSSKKRNIEFNLSKELFSKLIKQNCHYCKSIPSTTKITVNKKYVMYYNGVDRLINSTGYVEDNCVTCCWKCNQMKRNYDFKDFFQHIQLIVATLSEGSK